MTPPPAAHEGPAAPRIISLVPSSTETLLALGVEVLACTRFCEQPQIPHVGGTKNPDIAAIIELAPDLVVFDREENRIEDHEAIVAAGIEVFASDVTDVASGLEVVSQLAELAGVDAPTLQMLGAAATATPRRAFVPIWRRPWMTVSSETYGASVLRHVGIELVDVDADGAYPTVELDDVAAREPDLVLVPSEPYEFDDSHIAELAAAMPNAAVVRVDGQDLFWWGSRTPAAVSRLARALALRPTR